MIKGVATWRLDGRKCEGGTGEQWVVATTTKKDGQALGETYQVMRITTETSSKTGSPRLLRHASNRTLKRKRRERSRREADASAITIAAQTLVSESVDGFGFRKKYHERSG